SFSPGPWCRPPSRQATRLTSQGCPRCEIGSLPFSPLMSRFPNRAVCVGQRRRASGAIAKLRPAPLPSLRSLPRAPEGNTDFVAAQRERVVFELIRREQHDCSLLISVNLVRERAGFETKVEAFVRIVDGVRAEIGERAGHHGFGF